MLVMFLIVTIPYVFSDCINVDYNDMSAIHTSGPFIIKGWIQKLKLGVFDTQFGGCFFSSKIREGYHFAYHS